MRYLSLLKIIAVTGECHWIDFCVMPSKYRWVVCRSVLFYIPNPDLAISWSWCDILVIIQKRNRQNPVVVWWVSQWALYLSPLPEFKLFCPSSQTWPANCQARTWWVSLDLCTCTSTHNQLSCPRIPYINTPHWRTLMHWNCCCVKRQHTQNDISHKWQFIWLVGQQANQCLLSSHSWISICRRHSNERNKGMAMLICRRETDICSIDRYCWVEYQMLSFTSGASNGSYKACIDHVQWL